jgi:hypothetical protein
MKQTAEIVCDTLVNNERFTTVRYEIWRPLHSELLTYRSGVARNASSSRAVPFLVNLELVKNDPFVPNYIGKEHKGMMPTDIFTGCEYMEVEHAWRIGAAAACANAEFLSSIGVAKSICNRLLEPYNTINVLMTGSKKFWLWMFRQRCSRGCGGQGDAEPNLSELVDKIKELYDGSVPKEHTIHAPYLTEDLMGLQVQDVLLACSARCARLSYCQHGSPKLSLEADLALAGRLVSSTHLSPFEHLVMCPEWATIVADSIGGDLSNAQGNSMSMGCYTFREILETVKSS